jgi:thioredoxin 1
MKGNAAILLLILSFFIVCGCIEEKENNPDSSGCGFERIVQITEPGQIKEAIQRGPALLMAGSSKDPEYIAQAAVFEELAEEYEGRATVLCVDSEQDPDLAKRFLGRKDEKKLASCVILNIERGMYLYMLEDGNVTPEYPSASFSEFTEKEVLERTLDHAVRLREEDSQK